MRCIKVVNLNSDMNYSSYTQIKLYRKILCQINKGDFIRGSAFNCFTFELHFKIIELIFIFKILEHDEL